MAWAWRWPLAELWLVFAVMVIAGESKSFALCDQMLPHMKRIARHVHYGHEWTRAALLVPGNQVHLRPDPKHLSATGGKQRWCFRPPEPKGSGSGVLRDTDSPVCRMSWDRGKNKT